MLATYEPNETAMPDHSPDRLIAQALAASGKTRSEAIATVESFRDFATEVVRLVLPGCAVSIVDEQSISVRHPATEAVRTLALRRILNGFESWRADDDLRDFVLMIGTLMSDSVPEERPSIHAHLDKIVPLLKSEAYAKGNAEVIRAQAIESGRDPETDRKVSWRGQAGFVAFAVVNFPDKFDFITLDRLEGSGLTGLDIQNKAMNNLQSLYRSMDRGNDYSEGLKEISGHDGVAASFLLLDEFLASESEQAGDDLCIFSGGPGHLFLVPCANVEFIDYMLGRIVSGTLKLGEIPPLIYRDGVLEMAEIEIAEPTATRADTPSPR
jgi:uncharacterized protein YtpQ (UPF0354 family)